MITEHLMKPGSFDVQLIPETPKFIRNALALYGHVVVYDAAVDPRIIADADILAGALYVGVVRRKPTPFALAGAHITIWLGDEEGKGDLFESGLALAGSSFAAAVAAALPSHGAVQAGIITPINYLTANNNPGFETTGGWTDTSAGTGASTLQDNTNPHTGSYALKLTNPSTGNYGGAGTTQGIPVSGLSNLYYEFWAKGTAGAAMGPFRIVFVNPDGVIVLNDGVAVSQPANVAGATWVDRTFTQTAAYTQYTGNVAVPGGYTYAFIEIYALGNGTSPNNYYDDILIAAQNTVTQTFNIVDNMGSPRAILDWLMNYFGAEYRVRTDATSKIVLDAGQSSKLFRTGLDSNLPINAILMPLEGGRDPAEGIEHGVYVGGPNWGPRGVLGIEAKELNLAIDSESQALRVWLSGASGSSAAATAPGPNPYKDLRGNAAWLTKAISQSATASGNAAAQAAAAAGEYPLRYEFRVSTERYNVMRDIRPGDWIHTYDPDNDIVDYSNPVNFRGQIIYPTALRCFAITWPVEDGMSVYYRDSAGVYTDLTPWIAFENPGTSFEIGAPNRGLTVV